MKRYFLSFIILIFLALPVVAHITPNVTLIRKGDFVRQNLSGATHLFEKQLRWDSQEMNVLKKAGKWSPSEDDVKTYVGRNDQNAVVGYVVFLWAPSEHGPVGIGVAFDPSGTILRADVTDIGTEPLTWVRPLLDQHVMDDFSNISLNDSAASKDLSAQANSSMTRYYAQIITENVARAQLIARIAINEK